MIEKEVIINTFQNSRIIVHSKELHKIFMEYFEKLNFKHDEVISSFDGFIVDGFIKNGITIEVVAKEGNSDYTKDDYLDSECTE